MIRVNYNYNFDQVIFNNFDHITQFFIERFKLSGMQNRFWAVVMVMVLFGCNHSNKTPITIIPTPQEISQPNGSIDISEGFNIIVENESLNPLIDILHSDYSSILKKRWRSSEIELKLAIDSTLKLDAYTISADENIEIKGGSYQSVALAISTFWQIIEAGEISKIEIKDYPNYNYRSVMLDLARAWHSPETIKTIIDLCRWYKINYLHLHLTDDSAFTFPSDEYPNLATEGHSYTKKELIHLNQYAYDRGVVLIPEFDVPGHSSQFVKKMPELFGIEKVDNNPYTINMGKEEVYEALNILIEEVSAIFTYSPFIHIGGDEAFFDGMEDDPAIISYMKKHELPNMHELFLHFLIRMNDIIKKNGKQTIVWAGFGEKGELQIPNDIIVLLWEHTYHDPKDLVQKKYPIINASFKPLYVVNNRKWEAQYIYEQWNPNRWEAWSHQGDFYGEELKANELVLGATLCAWEQKQYNQLPRLRDRVASVAQQLWSNPKLSWEEFSIHQAKSDQQLDELLFPFEVELQGLTHPELDEGNFNEHLWFDKSLKIHVTTRIPGLTFQYSMVKTPLNQDWNPLPQDLELIKSGPLHIRALDPKGKQIGHNYHQRFFHKPLQLSAKGLWKDLPISSWEKHRFEDTLWITLTSSLKDHTIRYNTTSSKIDLDSKLYEGPISITNTAYFKAQLFDQNNNPVGTAIHNNYYKIWNEKSLTTGKPITASNDHIRPNCAAPANNGRISLWDMWGDHVSEENWVQVDLEKIETISRFKVYTFWDNYRYYQYKIEGSLDGENWNELVDFSKNKELATEKGIEHKIPRTQARYVRIHMLFNSANPGLHLVEFQAFEN